MSRSAFVVEITSEIDQIFTCLLQIGHTSTDLDVSMRNQSSDAYITQFTISSIDMSISLEYLTEITWAKESKVFSKI